MVNIEKAYEITDAKITFVSLVDRAANKKTFLLKKEDGGKASFTTFGRIVKKDAQSHYVTGIVYEPLTEDTHGNYMTEAEIEKAAHWFAKNGNQVDLQHSFEPLSGAAVVESWIAKADFEIEGQTIKKGTWLMTVEVTDESVWAGIEKGAITGFSMGGIGTYSEKDVNLDEVTESASGEKAVEAEQSGAKNKDGASGVKKGAMADVFAERSKNVQFWEAFNTLQNVLCPYDPLTGACAFEADEGRIRQSLTEFTTIVTDILASKEPIAKALEAAQPVRKAGRAISSRNLETLHGIRDTLDAFLKGFETREEPDPEERSGQSGTDEETAEQKEGEGSMTKQEREEIAEIVKASVREAMRNPENTPSGAQDNTETSGAAPVGKSVGALETPKMTPESVGKMVEEAVAKAMGPKPALEITMTPEQVEALIQKSVEAAVEPLRKARGLPSNLGSASGVEKREEQHYLHGIL